MGWIDTIITIVIFVVLILFLYKMFKPMLSGIWDPISGGFERLKEGKQNKEKSVSVTYE
jgi:cbb3-type cytochrome oxidase subunit 3